MSLLLENVKKSYREPDGSVLPILDIERFELKENEQVALIGESGSGKSTLLNVISGITAADSGKVTIAGTEIASMAEVVRDRFRAERIGFVFQTFNLLPAFSALENVLQPFLYCSGKGTSSSSNWRRPCSGWCRKR